MAPRRLPARLSVSRPWRSGDIVKVRFTSSPRLAPWPQADSPLVGVFDGPLCLALSSSDANVDAGWHIATTTGGTPVLDGAGQPVLVEHNGEKTRALRPLGDEWLSLDVSNPHRLRVLFGKFLAG